MTAPRHPPLARRARGPWWLLGALPLLPALGVGFLLDDWIGLARLREAGWPAVAAQLRPLGGEFLRPLGWALVQAELVLFGPRGPAFHAVHLALFVLGAYLTGRLAAAVAGDGRLLPAAALLALVYPGRTEAYAWIASAFDLLALDLALAVLLLHLRWRERPAPGRALALVALALGSTLAKESAYAVVAVLVAWELVPGLLPPLPARRRAVALAASAGGYVVGALYRAWAIGGVGGYADTGFTSTVGGLARFPEALLRAAFLPVNPRFGALSAALGIACAAALALVLALAVLRAVKAPGARRPLIAGAALALAGLLPVLPYLQPSAAWTSSRFLTLFGAGLAIAASAAWSGAPDRADQLARTGFTALAVAWAAATVLSLLPWQEAARRRDRILAAIGEDTRTPGRHAVWIAGPINSVRGAHLLGGALQAAVDVSFPEREIEADSEFFQSYQHRPVGPPAPRPGVAVHRYRLDPSDGTVERTGGASGEAAP